MPVESPIALHQYRCAVCVVVMLCLWLGSEASAQTSPLQQQVRSVSIDSGQVAGPALDMAKANQPHAVFSEMIHIDDAAWMRLQFEEVSLAGSMESGNASFLRITSLHDGAHQVLDAQSLAQWRMTSAYFNGDAVLLELLAYPTQDADQTNRVVINRVWMSDGDEAMPPVPLSICDGVDERQLSDGPADARSLPVGCTAWLFNERHYCLLTAGHCANNTDVVEFNVPLQANNGGWIFSHPDDQYAVDPDSKQISSGGGGCTNDWSYFGVFPNSNTGLTPLQAQGSSYPLADAAPPATGQPIEIRGYGTTSSPVPPSWNRAQKEHTGPFVVSSGNTIRYRADTTGGNSGSAVVDLTTGLAIGVHTCAGCTSSGGSNLGTAIQNSGLQTALENPQGVCAWLPPGPTNSVCINPFVVSTGATPFTNIDATTTGPDEAAMCGPFGLTTIEADVWFGHIVTCTGELTVSVCDSDFPATLGIYPFPCPNEPGTIIACNAGACPGGAEITLSVIQGDVYRFRVGGLDGAQGEGTLVVTCTPLESCLGDVNNDGVVNVSDLLILLSEWGTCDDCISDLNEDGQVNVSDLLLLLGQWGECS